MLVVVFVLAVVGMDMKIIFDLIHDLSLRGKTMMSCKLDLIDLHSWEKYEIS